MAFLFSDPNFGDIAEFGADPFISNPSFFQRFEIFIRIGKYRWQIIFRQSWSSPDFRPDPYYRIPLPWRNNSFNNVCGEGEFDLAPKI